jgi:hypothetical protein
MNLTEINFLAVLIGTITSFALGFLWYGPLFGKSWQRHVGLTNEELKEVNMALVFGPAFILTFIMGLVIAALIPVEASIADGALLGFVLGLGLIATSFGVNYLFARQSVSLYLIDASYQVFVLVIFGVIISLMS